MYSVQAEEQRQTHLMIHQWFVETGLRY